MVDVYNGSEDRTVGVGLFRIRIREIIVDDLAHLFFVFDYPKCECQLLQFFEKRIDSTDLHSLSGRRNA